MKLDGAFRLLGAGSRRQVLRGVLAAAGAALAGVAPRRAARAHPSSSFCAESPELLMLELINQFRRQNGKGELELGQNISAAAEHHSADMANRNYFSHTTKGSSQGPSGRMVDHGYPANSTSWGENIYAGWGTRKGVDLSSPQAAMDWWKNSSGHRANMLRGSYTVIGIARVSNPNSTYRNYWTTDFGGANDQDAVTCGSPPPPPPPPPPPGRLTISGYSKSTNSTGAKASFDGDPATAWRTNGSSTPTTGWVRYDLGRQRALTEIRWKFSQTGAADRFTIQVSNSTSNWQTLATRGNAAAANTWESLDTTASARYVRFRFENPNGDRTLGYLSEVEIYGTSVSLSSASLDDGGEATASSVSSASRGRDRDRKRQRRRNKRKG
jgi:uncharacterized protein YkwD